jgi:hypothetical protein
VFKKNIMRAFFNAGHTAGTSIGINDIGAIFQVNRLDRANFCTYPTLVTKMNPVVTRCRESAFNPQCRFGWIHFFEIFHGTHQPTNATSGTVFVFGS